MLNAMRQSRWLCLCLLGGLLFCSGCGVSSEAQFPENPAPMPAEDDESEETDEG